MGLPLFLFQHERVVLLRVRTIYGWMLLLLIGCNTSGENDIGSAGDLFTDISVKAGFGDVRHHAARSDDKLFPEIMGAGGGFIDYNNDHWPDILLVNGGELRRDVSSDLPAVSLFENNQDGTFSDVTEKVGLATYSVYGSGVAVADFDNDGDQDFALSTVYKNLLFRNDGGVFVEVGDAAGFSDLSEWSTAILFMDADNDGWLDILVGNYVAWTPELDKRCTLDGTAREYCTPEIYAGIPLRLYKNVDGAQFVNISEKAGIAINSGKTLGLATLDFNRDGWIDIVATNDTERDLLYENLKDGTFKERGMLSGIALSSDGEASAGMGVDVGYIDQSGEPTVFIGNFSREALSVFQHQASGRFRNQTTSSRIGRPSYLTLTFGLSLFDGDLDGDQDLFVVNGHVHPSVASAQDGITFSQAPQLYLNDGGGKFDEFEPASTSVLADTVVGRGAAYADIDNDGDLDILFTVNNGRPRIWQNNASSKHALQVTLEGGASNKSALGGRVEIITGSNRQIQYVKSGSSYLSASELRLTFGLDTATEVDTILVTWPLGQRDTLTAFTSDQHILLKEGIRDVLQLNSF